MATWVSDSVGLCLADQTSRSWSFSGVNTECLGCLIDRSLFSIKVWWISEAIKVWWISVCEKTLDQSDQIGVTGSSCCGCIITSCLSHSQTCLLAPIIAVSLLDQQWKFQLPFQGIDGSFRVLWDFWQQKHPKQIVLNIIAVPHL